MTSVFCWHSIGKNVLMKKGEIITEYGEIPSGLKIVMKGNVGVCKF